MTWAKVIKVVKNTEQITVFLGNKILLGFNQEKLVRRIV